MVLSDNNNSIVTSHRESTEATASLHKKRKRIQWEVAFEHLKSFQQKHGNLSVPQNFCTSDGIHLGHWIKNQRSYLSQQMKRGELDAKKRLRVSKLEALGMQFGKRSTRTEVREFDWEAMMQQLSSFKKRHGHTRVHKLLDHDHDLAIWASQQRQEYRALLCGQQSTFLNRNQVSRLRQVGFEFDSSSSSSEDSDDDDMSGDSSVPQSSSPCEPALLEEEDENSVSFRTQESTYMAELDEQIYLEEERAFMKSLDFDIWGSEQELEGRLTQTPDIVPTSISEVSRAGPVGTKEVIRKSQSYYVATMMLPSHLTWSATNLVNGSQSFPIENGLQSLLDAIETPSVKLRIESIPDDPKSLKVIGEGKDKKDLLQQSELIELWMVGCLFDWNYELLIEAGTKVELECDSSKKLGSTIGQGTVDSGPLILYGADDGGQLAMHLGTRIMKMGAAIAAMDGDESCRHWTIHRFKAEIMQRKGKKYKLSLYLHPDADTSQIDPTCIIRGVNRKRKRSSVADDPSIRGGSSVSSAKVAATESSARDHANAEEENVILSSKFKQVRDIASTDHEISHASSVVGTTLDGIVPQVSLSEPVHQIGLQETCERSESTREGQSLALPSVDAKSSPEQKPETSALASYSHFKRKFASIVAREYRYGLESALARMWLQHKKRFGQECGESCRCAVYLPFLTKEIRSDREHRPFSFKSKHLCGLTGNFAATFMPKLVVEYPKESDLDLLRRLTQMWELHKKNYKFGVKCVTGCKCESGWEFVFRKGLSVAGHCRPFARERYDIVADLSQVSIGSAPGALIPPEQRLTDPPALLSDESNARDSGNSTQKSETSDNGHVLSIIPRKIAKPNLTDTQVSTQAKNASRTEKKVYEIEFDTKQPLGFYTITEKSGFASACKIVSVFPQGQRSDDLRIQEGTLIVGARCKDFESDILDHFSLRAAYEKARKSELKLTLCFINSMVEGRNGVVMRGVKSKDWTVAGRYLGQHKEGWNGEGWNVATGINVDCKKAEGAKQVSTNSIRPQPGAGDGWFIFDALRPLRATAGTSCLKEKSERVRRELLSVRFSNLLDQRFYEKGSKTCRFHVKSDSVTVLDESSQFFSARGAERQDTIDTFSVTILQSSLQNCLQLLENGAFASLRLEDPEALIRPLKRHLLELREKLKIYPHDKSTSALEAEAMLKEKLLKLYVHAFHTARLAKSIKNWLRFEICVTQVDRINLTSLLANKEAPILSVSVSAVFEAMSDLQPLQSLPKKAMATTVDFRDSDVSYLVNYNHVVGRDRSLRVELEHVSGNQSVNLGDIVIPLEKVKDECPYLNNWRELSFEAKPNPFLSSATVRVRCRRVRIEQLHVEKKRRDACNRLNELVEWVKRLNQDLALRDHSLRVLPHVTVSSGITLLHSAIFLRERKLVQRLLDLGADPLVKSTIGSPLSLAQNIAEGGVQRSIAIASDARKENQVNFSDDSRCEGDQEEDKIFQLLRDHVKRLNALETADSLSESESG